MTTPDQDKELEIGLEHHTAGRLQEAEKIYRQILEKNPRHAGALHFLGAMALQMKRYKEGADLIRQAIAIDPSVPEYHNNLGSALMMLAGCLPEAIASLQKAIALKPDFGDAFHNLGIAYVALSRMQMQDEQIDEAADSAQKAIALKPVFADACCSLPEFVRCREKSTNRFD